jgi:hypothetical protein
VALLEQGIVIDTLSVHTANTHQETPLLRLAREHYFSLVSDPGGWKLNRDWFNPSPFLQSYQQKKRKGLPVNQIAPVFSSVQQKVTRLFCFFSLC